MIAEDSTVMPIWDPPTPPLSDSEHCYATVDDDMWGPYLRTPMGDLPLCVEDTERSDTFISAGLPSPTSPLQEKQPSSAEAITTTVPDDSAGVPDTKESLVPNIAFARSSAPTGTETVTSVSESLTSNGKVAGVASPFPKKVTDDYMVCYLADRLLAPNCGGAYRNTNVNWDYVSEAMAALTNCSISPRQCLTRWENRRSGRGQLKTEAGGLVPSTGSLIDLGAEASSTLCSASPPLVNFAAQYGLINMECFAIMNLPSAKEEGSSLFPPIPSDPYLGISDERCVDYERFMPQIRQYSKKYQEAATPPDTSKQTPKLSRFEEVDKEAYQILMTNSKVSNLTFLPSFSATHPFSLFADTEADVQVSPAKAGSGQSRQLLPTTTQPYMIGVGNGLDVLVSECPSIVGQPMDSSGFSRPHGHFMRVKPTHLGSRSAAAGGTRRELGSRGTPMPIITTNHSYQSQVQVRPKPVLPQARMHLSAQRGFPSIQQHQRIRSPAHLSGVRHVSFSGQSPIMPSCSRPISIRSIRPRQTSTLMASPTVGLSEPRHSPPQLRSIPSINMIMSSCPPKSLIDDLPDSSANQQ